MVVNRSHTELELTLGRKKMVVDSDSFQPLPDSGRFQERDSGIHRSLGGLFGVCCGGLPEFTPLKTWDLRRVGICLCCCIFSCRICMHDGFYINY